MPRIPGASEVGQVAVARDPGTSASVPDVAGMIGTISQVVIDTAEEIREKRQEAEDVAFLSHIESNLDPAFTKTFEEVKLQAVEGPDSLVPILNERLESVSQGLIDSSRRDGFRPSESAIQRAQLAAARRRGQFGVQAVTFENNQRVSLITSSVNEGIRVEALGVFNNPDSLEDGIKKARSKLEAARGILPAAEFQESVNNLRFTFTENAVAGLINQDPEEAIRRLQEGVYDDGLSAESKDQLFDNARVELRRKKATAKAEQDEFIASERARIRKVAKDEVAFSKETGRRTGNLSNDVIREHLPEEEAQKLIDQIGFNMEVYAVGQEVKFTSRGEDEILLGEMQVAIESGAPGVAERIKQRDILRSALSQKYQKLGIGTEKPGDPAGYVFTNRPELSERLQEGMDPQNPNPQLVQSVIDESLSIQEDLGVHSSRRRALPKSMVQQLTRGVLSAEGDQLRTEFERLEELVGTSNFDRLFEQMAEEGLPTEYLVAAQLTDPRDAVAFSLVTAVIDKNINDLKKSIDDSLFLPLKEQLDDQLLPFSQVFNEGDLRGVNAPEIMARYYDVMLKMALVQMASGASEIDAAKSVTDSVINNRFLVINENGAGSGAGIKAFVPRMVEDPETGSFLQVDRQAVIKSAVLKQNEEELRKFGPVLTRGGENDTFITRNVALQTALNSGYWVTNSDSTGLILVMPDRSGVGGTEVFNAQGEVFEIKFADIAKNPPPTDAEEAFDRTFRLFGTGGLN